MQHGISQDKEDVIRSQPIRYIRLGSERLCGPDRNCNLQFSAIFELLLCLGNDSRMCPELSRTISKIFTIDARTNALNHEIMFKDRTTH